MKLGLNDMHPSVGDVLRARVWQMRVPRHMLRAEDAGARRVLGVRWQGVFLRALVAIPIGAAIGAGLAAASGASGSDIGGIAFAGGYFGAIAAIAGTIALGGRRLNRSVTASELRALASSVQMGEPETVYLDTVCALMDAGGNLADTTGLEILSAAGELLEQARGVAGRLGRLRQAASTNSVSELETERAGLTKRIEAAHDAQARADLNQSLAMCDERLRNARSLEPLVERLDAQREVIHQTMLSVRASVSRLQVAPSGIAAPDIEHVRRVIGDITTQTRAVEDAVEQVMALRA